MSKGCEQLQVDKYDANDNETCGWSDDEPYGEKNKIRIKV
jgi:hypothetical protein